MKKFLAIIPIVIISLFLVYFLILYFISWTGCTLMNPVACTFVKNPTPVYIFHKIWPLNSHQEAKDFCDENCEVNCDHCRGAIRYGKSFCNGEKENFQEDCFNYLAYYYKDLSYCQRTICSGKVINEMAEENIELCEEVSIRNSCYHHLARHFKDISYCDQIDALKDKDNCIYVYIQDNNEWDLCEQIQEMETKDSCYFLQAQDQENSASCEKIIDTTKKDRCYNSFNK